MPKHWSVKLLLLVVVCLSACRNFTNQQIQPNRQEDLQGQLVMWISTLDKEWTEAILNEFKEDVSIAVGEFTDIYDDVDIVLEFVPADQLIDEFATQANRGFGPDLILTRSRHIPVLSQAGALKDLSDHEIDMASFRTDALRQVHFQGKLYGWPVFLHTQALCYNKAKVNKIPITLSDLRAQARAGYSVGMVSGFRPTFWGTQIFGGQLFDRQGHVILDRNLGWSQWMEWLKATKDEPNFILSSDESALQDAFIQGRLAYIVCNSGWIPTFRKVLGTQQFGLALLPGKPDRPAGPFLEPSVLLLNQASNANQTQLALKFANFFTNVAKQRETATELQALIPVNTNVDIDSRLFPILGVLQKQSQSGIAIPLNTRYELQNIFSDADVLYQKVLAGEMAADTAAAQLTDRLNTELTEP